MLGMLLLPLSTEGLHPLRLPLIAEHCPQVFLLNLLELSFPFFREGESFRKCNKDSQGGEFQEEKIEDLCEGPDL